MKEQGLFKDKEGIKNTSNQLINLEELAQFIRKGSEEVLLFGGVSKDSTTPHKPNHKTCDYRETDSQRKTEKRICRCMYYNNLKEHKNKCNHCSYKCKWELVNSDEYKILDYETPSSYVIEGVGGVDLLIQSGTDKYAVEVKAKGSTETIVRMLAEILTYTTDIMYQDFTPAICFFEGSSQYKQMEEIKNNTDLIEILSKKHIEVFYFSYETEGAVNKFRINRFDWK